MPLPSRSVYAGVFAISAATLLFQVTLVRIFSVSIWYHFAFLVVSIALFGIGLSGVVTSLRAPSARAARDVGVAPLLFAVSTILAYVAANAIPFSPFRILQDPKQVAFFLLYDLLLMVPFFFSGVTIVLLLRAYPVRAGRLYAFDLVGAAAGTLLLFVILPWCGARGAVAMSGLLGAVACTLLAPAKRLRAAGATVALVLLAPVVRPALLPDVRMDATKPVVTEIKNGAALVFTEWNALARIDVTEKPHAPPMIFIDAAAATPVTARRSVGLAASDVSTLACQMRPGASVVVIGAGGGIDVQNALALSAARVTAVEINPIVIDVVGTRYRDYTGDVLRDARVRIIRDEGRSYIARSRERFDIVQLTLIDTWAASVSGAYSLSENYLYTAEAFRSYLEHVSDSGVLSITRWYYELPRLASLARAALDEMDVKEPWRHVLIVENGLRGVMLVKRTPFSIADMNVARRYVAAQKGAEILQDPTGELKGGFFGAYLAAQDLGPFHDAAIFALRPVHDESPFFFQMAKWGHIKWKDLRSFGKGGFLEPLAVPVGQIALASALALGVLLSLLLLALPLAVRAVPRERRWTWLGYFFGLGLAYIIVEVVLMQRFALFLGHPTYSVTAILFAILLFSGLGAAWSDRRRGNVRDVIRPVRWALPASILLLTFAVPPLLSALLGLPLPVRLLIAVALVGPVAFVMGIPFPTGIRAIGATDARHVAWAWAANGCASVVGSVCAVLGAMIWSFSVMLMIAMLIYMLAFVVLARLRIDIA